MPVEMVLTIISKDRPGLVSYRLQRSGVSAATYSNSKLRAMPGLKFILCRSPTVACCKLGTLILSIPSCPLLLTTTWLPSIGPRFGRRKPGNPSGSSWPNRHVKLSMIKSSRQEARRIYVHGPAWVGRGITTRQYARLVSEWIASIGLGSGPIN
jgi:hypothetical protein